MGDEKRRKEIFFFLTGI